MSISDTVVALNFGRKIAEGTPAEVQSNADVIRAYLGSDKTMTAILLEAKRMDAYYGPVQVLYGIDYRGLERRHHHAARRQWRRQDHDAACALPE